MPDDPARTDALLPIDTLVGRPVVDRDGQPVGRVQEFRVDTSGGEWVITDFVIGVGGLLERMNVGLRLLVGSRRAGRVARVDHVDLSNPRHVRLTCRADDLPDA